MTYSRKAIWTFRSAAILLFAAFVLYARTAHPLGAIFPWIRGGVLVAFVALAVRANFHLDEIQRGARMREWYFGMPFGVVAICIAVIGFQARPGLLDGLVDFLFGHHAHPPASYFGAGVALTFVALGAGTLLVRAYVALPKRGA